ARRAAGRAAVSAAVERLWQPDFPAARAALPGGLHGAAPPLGGWGAQPHMPSRFLAKVARRERQGPPDRTPWTCRPGRERAARKKRAAGKGDPPGRGTGPAASAVTVDGAPALWLTQVS